METATTRPTAMDDMTAAHEANDGTMAAVLDACERRGLGIAVYRSSLARFDGHWRYAAYECPEEGRPSDIRSRRVVAYQQARYSKRGRPSIIGEREALESLLANITGEES